MRRAVIDRRTTETQIALTIALDGQGRYRVQTGIGFLITCSCCSHAMARSA